MPASSHTALWAIAAAVTHEAVTPYQGIQLAHVAPVGYGSRVAHEAIYSLNVTAALAHEAVYDMTARGILAHDARYDMPALDSYRTAHTARWTMPPSSVTTITESAFLEWRGERIDILEASAAQDENGGFWRVRARLAKAGDYLRLARLDPIILDVFGDRYDLVIESLGRSRAGSSGVQQGFEIAARSRLWASLGDQATRVTKTWPAVMARAAVEELAGEAVDWRIVNWLIPAGRLAAVNEAPMSVIKRIVAAPGGVVESDKDGGLIARYQYPVSIPNAPTASIDHTLAESGTITNLSERLDGYTKFDKLFLSDESRSAGYLSAERDPDQQEDILGGEEQRFVVTHSDDVEVSEVKLSAGTLVVMDSFQSEVEEEIIFGNTNEAQLSKPVDADFAWTWYGAGLGTLTVGPDGQKVTAAQSGVGVAKVTYKSQAKRYAVRAPLTLGGESLFPIIVYVIGALVEDEPATGKRRIIVQRGAGGNQGDDVVEPLAGNDNVLLHRGRNMIDDAAEKGIVALSTGYESEILNGELVAVPDSQIGEAWRGKVTNIEHRVERSGKQLTVGSSVTVERFL